MANLQIRLNQIANGMKQAGPNSPVFVVKDKRVKRISRAEYTILEEEAESLSYWAGTTVLPEQLIK